MNEAKATTSSEGTKEPSTSKSLVQVKGSEGKIFLLHPEAMLFEPRFVYDEAIIDSTKDGAAVYCCDKLIEVIVEASELPDNEDSVSEALDHFGYNMTGTAMNYKPNHLRAHFRDFEGETF